MVAGFTTFTKFVSELLTGRWFFLLCFILNHVRLCNLQKRVYSTHSRK